MQVSPIVQKLGREGNGLSRFFVLTLVGLSAWLIAALPLLWATLLVGGTIFVAIVFIQPRWALYMLPFAVPFGSIREVSVGPATVGMTEALLALFLAAWVARGISRRELRLQRPPLTLLFAAWYGVMVLSLLNSTSLAASVKELLKWGETFALYAVAVQELRRRDIAILAGTTLAAGSLAALEGIYQGVFQVGPPGFLFPLAGRLWLRAYGRFIQPNPFAGYLGLVLPLAVGLVAAALGLSGRSRGGAGRATSLLQRLVTRGGIVMLAGASALTMAGALFLTLSRGGWIGAGAGLLAVGALLSRRGAWLSLVALCGVTAMLALGGTGFLPEALKNRVTDFLPYINVFNVQVRGVGIDDQNFAVLERLAHWQAGVEMWAEKPWLGQGVGNYAAAYPNFYIPPWEDPLGHAHNLFLNTLAETGLFGLAAYLLFWGGALWLSFRAVRRSDGLWKGVAAGTFAALIHLHTHNFFDNLYVHGMYLHVALLLAIATRLGEHEAVQEYR